MLAALTPLDGRYQKKTQALRNYFSEYALIKYRIIVEVKYLKALKHIANLPNLEGLPDDVLSKLESLAQHISLEQAQAVKDIERTTNHDVKAVEYFIKEEMQKLGGGDFVEMIHFALTSQDINNTAFPMMHRDALEQELIPTLQRIIDKLETLAEVWKDIPMLARTHGQPASPTRLGKEIKVFVERLEKVFSILKSIPHTGKFGGATGNFNAHHVVLPTRDWVAFGNHFLYEYLGLTRQQTTTQIEHYDTMAAIFQTNMRINTILIDFCRDIWTYISMDYFKQKVIAGEVGSSAMPHKVNPIDFENAEGNLGISNALFGHLAAKLPISRLQRDLTDSTVLRNIGVPYGHSIIAYQSILKGLDKLLLNPSKLEADLDANWAVVAEAIQNILRYEGYPKPYEALKSLTRGQAAINKERIHDFIDSLAINEDLKTKMKAISPFNYTGV